MTNKEKIAILQKMKELIETKEIISLCPAFCKATGRNYSDCDPYKIEYELIDFGFIKPTTESCFWWPIFSHERIDAIDNLIESLQ